MCNVNTLTRGADFPSAQFVLNLAPTRSIVKETQAAGRALRNDPNFPNKVATVVDFMDSGAENNPPIIFGDILLGQAEFQSYRNWLVEKLQDTDEQVIHGDGLGERVHIEGVVDVLTSIDKVLEVSKGRDINPFQNWVSINRMQDILKAKLQLSSTVGLTYLKRAVDEILAIPENKDLLETEVNRMLRSNTEFGERYLTRFSPVILQKVLDYFKEIKDRSDALYLSGWRTLRECSYFYGIPRKVLDPVIASELGKVNESDHIVRKFFDENTIYDEIELCSPQIIDAALDSIYKAQFSATDSKASDKFFGLTNYALDNRLRYGDMINYYTFLNIRGKYSFATQHDFDLLIVNPLKIEIDAALAGAINDGDEKKQNLLKSIIVQRVNPKGEKVTLYRRKQIDRALKVYYDQRKK
ncbi:MAG: hypothetical protein WCO33_00765 [bacterium]